MSNRIEVKKTNDMEKTGISMLVYGNPGVGKTTLAGTLPEKDTLLINIEGGTGVLSDRAIDMVEIDRNLDNLSQVLDLLFDDNRYHNIFFDSATELEMAMLVRLGREGKNHGVPELQHYQRVQFGLRNIMRQLRDLKDKGKNIVVTAHQMELDEYREDGSQITRIMPKVSKRIVKEICGLFDIVAYLGISNREEHVGERYLLLDPSCEIEAKNRFAHRWPPDSASKGKWFELPKGASNLKRLFEIINHGGQNETTPATQKETRNEYAQV